MMHIIKQMAPELAVEIANAMRGKKISEEDVNIALQVATYKKLDEICELVKRAAIETQSLSVAVVDLNKSVDTLKQTIKIDHEAMGVVEGHRIKDT